MTHAHLVIGFAFVALILATAFVTGRVYCLVPILYVERSSNPLGFWLTVLLWATALALGVAFAVMGRP